jgi:hypothetical protein
MQGAATQPMPVCIVEKRPRSGCPPTAAPRGLRLPGMLALSLAPCIPKYARRSRFAIGPGSLPQNAKLLLGKPLDL